MALVPWTYNNPRVDRAQMPVQTFSFQGKILEIFQDVNAEINVNQNTGLKLWDGAFLLSRHLEDKRYFPDRFWESKTCIELGAGCGLVSMVAWLLGARAIATDLEEVISHTNKTISVNVEKLRSDSDSKGLIQARPYRWGENLKEIVEGADVIVGSDIVYHKDAVKDLMLTINMLFEECGCTLFILAYKNRNLGEEIFFNLLKHHKYTITQIPKDSHPPDFEGSDYTIFYVTRT